MMEPFGPEAHYTGWSEAVGLFGHLMRGGEPAPYSPPGIMLEPGEDAFGEIVAEYSRFFGMNVPYTQRSTFAIGGPVFVAAALIGTAASNSSARRAAQRQAAPQWRCEGFPRTLLTNRPLLVHSPIDYQWLTSGTRRCLSSDRSCTSIPAASDIRVACLPCCAARWSRGCRQRSRSAYTRDQLRALRSSVP
jgi:hypothetical protein